MKVNIRRNGDYVVIEEDGTPYNVVSIDVDPYNKYDISEIKRYIEEHPEDVEYEDRARIEYESKYAVCINARKQAYQNESDPLNFGYQRGENTKEEWLAKVEEIKLRYPKE